jgi:hypothetical protein
MTGWWFSMGTPVSSTNKTDHNDITKILLKVALNTITLTPCLKRQGKIDFGLEYVYHSRTMPLDLINCFTNFSDFHSII